MILHYIKVAFRNLLKYKAQNIFSTIGLVVGLLCFSICFYFSRYIQNMDQCFRHYDRLVDIRLVHDGENLSGTPPVLGTKLRKDMGHVMEAYSSVAYSDEHPFEVYVDTAKHLPYTFNCIEVDSLYNRLFTPVFVAGSWEIASQTPNAIVLTESTALNIFSNVREAIGKQFILARRLQSSPDTTPRTGGISYTVQAVIKDIPTNISMSFMQKIEVLTLNDSEGIFWNNTSDGNNYTCAYTYALLRKGQKAQEMDQMFRASGVTHQIFGSDYQVVISPIGKEVKSASVTTLLSWITGVIGMLIGLVALLNFFHLQLGNMLSRRHEFSIRKVLGNGTFQLFVMLFVQLSFVIVIAFVLMLALVDLLSPKLQLSMFSLNLNIDKCTLMLQSGQYFLAILALSAVVCFWVAVYIRRISIQTGISRGYKRGKNVFRSFMQGVQFFICWLFVSITVALYLQSERTTSALFETLSKDEKNSILSLPLDYTFMKNEEKLSLIQRIRQYSGVKEVLLSDISYLNGVSGTGIQLEKNNSDKYVEVEVLRINSNFRSFMNIPLLSGRDIRSGSEMYVDQVFVEKTHKDILGKTLYQYNDEYVVSGVLSSFCASVYSNRSNSEQVPVVFLPSDFNDYVGHCYIKCHKGKEKEVAARVMQILKEILPENVEPAISTFQEDIKEAQALETKLKDIILFFSIVSLIITLLGVYTGITLDTERRQKEVAIRKINGAGIKHIVLLFTRLYLWILSITALLAFPIVYVILMQWKTMYKVFFNDGILYWGGIFMGVTLFVAFTVLSRILKIARINPAEIIKSE